MQVNYFFFVAIYAAQTVAIAEIRVLRIVAISVVMNKYFCEQRFIAPIKKRGTREIGILTWLKKETAFLNIGKMSSLECQK